MRKLTTETFIQRCREVHGDAYGYDQVVYTDMLSDITVTCPEHGDFLQKAKYHLYGSGCQSCKYEKIGMENSERILETKDDFVQKAKATHGDRYDYSQIIYAGQNKKVEIGCPDHGFFLQLGITHLLGSGCPRCAKRGRSSAQDAWLDHLGLPGDQEHRNVRLHLSDGSFICADGYDPATRTVYEFWGDWAHGNPTFHPPKAVNTKFKKTYGQLYEETQTKRKKIVNEGYTLIEIWEHEWKAMKPRRVASRPR